jgi:hypothetical protein
VPVFVVPLPSKRTLPDSDVLPVDVQSPATVCSTVTAPVRSAPSMRMSPSMSRAPSVSAVAPLWMCRSPATFVSFGSVAVTPPMMVSDPNFGPEPVPATVTLVSCISVRCEASGSKLPSDVQPP